MINPPLMPHQQKAVDELSNGKILKGGVGTGKSRTAMAYYVTLAPWVKLYVITTSKKRDSGDWQAEALLYGVEPIVDSWNNLINYEDVEDAFFIFDEQRVVGSGIWVKAFLKVTRKNEWILLSATPGDTWMDYIPVFLANGFYSTRTEFCREHVVFSRWAKFPKVERFLETRKLTEHLRSILVEMPYKRTTVRHTIDVFAEYNRELYSTVWKRRWNYLEGRPIRNVSELFSLLRRVVNLDPSRIDNIKNLMITHPRMIIFYNFDYELEMLRDLLDYVKVAEWNGHNHEPVPDGDEWVYLVQYAAGAEGWNCITTDTIVFYSMNYSYRATEQAKGRIDRLNTPYIDLYYYVFRSQSGIDCALFSALSSKREFNETNALKQLSGSQ
ncbi:MAG TPA: hypothetical protein VGI71_23940 [Scandinavium sp.]|jgi:hypothetical protein